MADIEDGKPTKRMERLAHLTPEEQALMRRMGVRIAAIRTSQPARTIASVAASAMIDESFLGELERGRVNPTVMTLSRLATTLGVPLEAFFDEA
jgi:transcriptional regulator with XRE-family HTH domain